MIMKKFFNTLFVIIAAMVTFAACIKEENAPASEIKTVQFFAESIETKTAFGTPDGTSYPTLWTENDAKVKLSLNYASPKDADVDEVSDDFKTAHFSAEIKDDESGEYTFYALSPASAYNNFNGTSCYLSANIPTTQSPLANSVDEKAQILYAVSEQFDEVPSSVSLDFHHFTAYGKLSFVNLGLGDATVTSVTITSSVNFAGRWNYMVESGEFMVNSGSTEITLTTSYTENLWFACAPVDMNNQTLTFTVNTDKGPLAKTVTLTGKKFEAGKIATMKVDMTGVQFAESVVYDLVTDPSDLTVDSKVIIVAAESDVALSATQNSNNRGEASVTKSADKSAISDPGSAVQIMTIEDGTKDGTISFNVGNGYLYAASSSNNYLRTESTKSDNSSWKVTITDGVATIIAQGTNTRNTMQYNNSSKLFSCYGSASQKDLAIYKLKGTGTAPLPNLEAPVVTAELSGDKTGIDVSWTAVDNATSYVISGVNEDVTTSTTSYEFTDLAPGTYTISVRAVAEGYTSATGQAAAVTVPSAEVDNPESDKYYVKVTSAPSDWSGTYLIVYKDGNLAFDGSLTSLDAVSNGKAVEISQEKIGAIETMNKIAFTIIKEGEGYSIKSASGYYIGNTSDANALKSSESKKYTNELSINADASVNIISSKSYLRYNATEGQARFRYYKSSSYSGQKAIYLYKLME